MSEYNKTNYETIKPFEPTNEIEQGYLDDILSVFENEIKVTGIKEYQSPYSTSKTVLIEYVSHPDFNWREDAVFNLLHDKDILDTSIDYTPITPDKSGTINDYLKRLKKQSHEVSQSEFSTIQSQEQLNKAVSFVRNRKWSNTMEEKTMTNKVTVGEVVIVRRPHTQQVKLYWYGDLDEAFDAWKNEGTFMQYENAENYINELGIESGEESEEVKKRLVDAGINLDSPFVEFAPSPSRDMELYPWDGNKVKFLSAIIEDDMHAAGIFIAEDGETYGDFVERILAGTRGHNEPSKTSIMATLGIPWDLSAGEALSLQGFTDMVIDYGDQGTDIPGWRDFTEQQQKVLALAYYAFREQEERKLDADEYDPRAWEVLKVEDGWNHGTEELKEWVAREIDHGVGIWEGLNEIELQIVEDQARNVKERQRTIEVEEGDYRASSYAAIESYYQDFLEAGFNRDNTQKQTRVEEWSLTVKDYNACCFADSKEVSFLSFKYSCDEKAVRSTLNIQPSVMDIRSPGKLELEYRFDHLGKEEFLATDSLSQNFITYKDCEYATPNKYNFPKEFKESLRNVAQKYTQTQFGKSIKEQFIAENERTKIPKQTIQGEKNMEQTEKKTPYYQQQIEKLHEAVKTMTAPFFLKEAVVGENNEVKNPGNYIEDNDKIILTPRPAVRTVKGNLLKGVNQLSAQIELDNMGSKAQTVLSFEDAKAAGTYIKKGSKSILLTGYDKDNERSKVYHVFSAGSVANKDVIKEQLYKNNELNKEKPWSKAIVCTDSNPEKYLGAYLAASASGSVLETDRKTVETFQKNFQNLIEKSISEKKHTAVFDVVRSAQMVKSEILKKNFSTWEKSQEQHKQGQQKGQQKKSPQSDMEMVF